jgi:hypothetical protein
MPTNRDFKRLVRGRMQKTGESYTTARMHLLQRPRFRRTPPVPAALAAPAAPPAPAPPAPADYARLAGMSDAAVKAKTGCTWERWVWALDRVEAHTWPHRDIAHYVHEKYRVRGWWAQMVTVGYERIRGLRQIGQRRGGGFEASKSRTFAVPVARLFRACSDARTRARWLPGVRLTMRTATRDRSLRITWPDGTPVALWFVRKGAARSQVALQHAGLADRAAATRLKAYWTERLDALGRVLARPARRRR